jgi:cell division protein FtsL
MIHPITLLGLGLVLGMLYLKYKSQPKDQAKRKPKQIAKTAKVLFAALIAWLMVSFALQHQLAKMDGTDQEPGMFERVVKYFAK